MVVQVFGNPRPRLENSQDRTRTQIPYPLRLEHDFFFGFKPELGQHTGYPQSLQALSETEPFEFKFAGLQSKGKGSPQKVHTSMTIGECI